MGKKLTVFHFLFTAVSPATDDGNDEYNEKDDHKKEDEPDLLMHRFAAFQCRYYVNNARISLIMRFVVNKNYSREYSSSLKPVFQ